MLKILPPKYLQHSVLSRPIFWFFFQTDSAPQIWTDHQKSDEFDFNDVKLLHRGKNPPLAANKPWLHCRRIAVGPFEADDDADVKSVLFIVQEIKISSYN